MSAKVDYPTSVLSSLGMRLTDLQFRKRPPPSAQASWVQLRFDKVVYTSQYVLSKIKRTNALVLEDRLVDDKPHLTASIPSGKLLWYRHKAQACTITTSFRLFRWYVCTSIVYAGY